MATKQIRAPKQARSIQLKEKILETAFQLFSQKGYFQTTTNEIAKTAGVSIGSLYSYFKDKDTIFLEILDRYHQQFNAMHHDFLQQIDGFKSNKKEWLRKLVESLIAIHESFKELNKEIIVLSYYNPRIAAIRDQQKAETQQMLMGYFELFRDEIKTKDMEAAAVVSFDFISAMVDRIAFESNTIGKERILNTGIEALAKFLLE